MSQSSQCREDRRARVFQLIHQSDQAETSRQKIRRLARQRPSAEDLERFKTEALRSLQSAPSVTPIR